MPNIYMLMLDWYLKYDDFTLTHTLKISRMLQNLSILLLSLSVISSFVTQVLSNKVLKATKGNEHTHF